MLSGALQMLRTPSPLRRSNLMDFRYATLEPESCRERQKQPNVNLGGGGGISVKASVTKILSVATLTQH